MSRTAPCPRCGARDTQRAPGISAFGGGYLFTAYREPPAEDPSEDEEESGEPCPMLFFDLLSCPACGHAVLAAQEDGAPLSRVAAALMAMTPDRRPCAACGGEAIAIADPMEIEGAGTLAVCVDADTGVQLQGWLCASCGAVESTLGVDAKTYAPKIVEGAPLVPDWVCLACGSRRVHVAELHANAAGAVYVPAPGVRDVSCPRVSAAVCADCASLSLRVTPAPV